MATEFERIKKAVDIEKQRKVQGEARITSLEDEEQRILANLSRELNQPVSSKEEAEKLAETLKNDIESKIVKMKEILESEGVSY
jgi:hypothetical protein